jgi:hypothetical protein
VNKNIPVYSTGDLVECIEAKDQSLYIKKRFVGKIGIVLKRIGGLALNGDSSSTNMYEIFIDDIYIHLHALDLKLLSGIQR